NNPARRFPVGITCPWLVAYAVCVKVLAARPPRTNAKYPYIVAIVIAGKGLNIGLSRRIVAFHKERHIQPRHGRSTIPPKGERAKLIIVGAFSIWRQPDLSPNSLAER